MADKYEVLSPIDFGRQYKKDELTDTVITVPLHEDDRENKGIVHPAAEGEDPVFVNLDDHDAETFLGLGVVREADYASPEDPHEPLEVGYEGEKARDEALENDEAYKDPPKYEAPKSKSSNSKASKKSSAPSDKKEG